MEVRVGWSSLVAQMVKTLPAMQETWVRSLGQEDPLEKGMATTLGYLPGEFHGQRSLAAGLCEISRSLRALNSTVD